MQVCNLAEQEATLLLW